MSKAKIIKKVIGDASLENVFQEMFGAKEADPDVIRPKYVRARSVITKIYKILLQFANFTEFKTKIPYMQTSCEEIFNFTEKMKSELNLDPSVVETEDNYRLLSPVELDTQYKRLKDCNIVKQLIILGSTLKNYDSYLRELNTLNGRFVAREPGLSLKIFPFSSLDLKQLWICDNMIDLVKKYVLTILHHIYVNTLHLYEVITSPDIDLDKFTAVLMDSIRQLRGTIPRCNEAFNRIERSVKLLKENFNSYYKDSVQAANPSLIMESFVIDVSKQGGVSPRITQQFGRIIAHMNKMSSNRPKNPTVDKLFAILNQNYDLMKAEAKITDIDDSPSGNKLSEDKKDTSKVEGKDEGKNVPHSTTKECYRNEEDDSIDLSEDTNDTTEINEVDEVNDVAVDSNHETDVEMDKAMEDEMDLSNNQK